MNPSRFLRTPKLEIVLQVTDAEAKPGIKQAWEVHDVERNRGFRVSLAKDALGTAPAGKKPLGRAFTAEEIDTALGLAIEQALVTPPEKVGGNVYDLSVTADDLYASLEL